MVQQPVCVHFKLNNFLSLSQMCWKSPIFSFDQSKSKTLPDVEKNGNQMIQLEFSCGDVDSLSQCHRMK